MRSNKRYSRNTSRSEDFLAREGRSPKRRNTRLSRRKRALAVFLSIILVFGGIFGAGMIYVKSLLGNAERVELDTNNLGIVPQTNLSGGKGDGKEPEVTNIALFGVDTRNIMSDSGNSDVLMIVTIDRVHNKIKLTSIARDSYVAVEGYGNTKINHAYSYGGAELAIKTINQNFQMDIQDFVTVNFSSVAQIIDYVGGVTVNVDSGEMREINKSAAGQNRIGVPTEPLTQTGDVLLSGGQAVAYARDRTTGGSDAERTGRQREVIMALYEKAMSMKVTEYPGLVSLVLEQCSTSLTDTEMLELGMWAVTANASIEQCSFPTAECYPIGGMYEGLWCYRYDLNNAADILHRYIYEDVMPAAL